MNMITKQTTGRVDPRFKQFATPIQLKHLEALEEHGSMKAAARAIGRCPNAISQSVQNVKKKAAIAGFAPDHDLTHTVPEPFIVRGTSTLYDEDGKVRQQWVKTKVDDHAVLQIVKDAVEELSKEVKPVKPTKAPTNLDKHLCNVYTLTDSHVGMLAWHKEGGVDWDLKIAEKTLIGCFERMVLGAPNAAVGVLAQLGDFLHSDSMVPMTPTSGHMLDQDGRFSKIVQAAIRILRHVVGLVLQKHKKCVVLMAEGNHDIVSSIWLRVLFKALFENEPRVEVIDSELPYYVYQHGQTMLCWHHGHLKKNDALPLLFASQYPTIWGLTTKRYAHTGHRHHEEIKQHSGMTVVQHSTLAARDAYAARGGWMSERQVTCHTYHDKWGQVGTNTIIPEMLDLH